MVTKQPRGLYLLPLFIASLFSSCSPVRTPSGHDLINGNLQSADPEAIPGESLSNEDAARVALIAFFDHLHAGDYAAAADLYGGSYEIMVAHNPKLEPEDHAALWRAACEINGAHCLQVASAHLQTDSPTPAGEFRFEVEFQRDDGSTFSHGPCCGEGWDEAAGQRTFTYRVRHQAEYLFQVLDPPVYTP